MSTSTMAAGSTEDGISLNDVVYLGRQPILDASLDAVGYELLYRSGPANLATFGDHSAATKAVLVHTLLEFGLRDLTGERLVFVNTPPSLFLDGAYRLLPPATTVLELLDGAVYDDAVLDELDVARAAGYRIALDDADSLDTVERLLPWLDIVKVDMLLCDLDEQARIVESVVRNEPSVLLLAEKVETWAEFERARDLGFGLFQGYFFSRPAVLSRRKLATDKAMQIQLLLELQREEADFSVLEGIVLSQPSLSYGLLKMTNSAYAGLPRRVASIREALVYLGATTVRQLVTLLLLTTEGVTNLEAARLGLVRAKMCEFLLTSHGRRLQSAGFTVGLLSVMDAVLEQPLDAVLDPLPLEEVIKAALIEHVGLLGRALDAVIRFELLEPGPLEESGFELADVSAAHLAASHWCDTFWPAARAGAA